MTYETITIQRQGSICFLQLDRPQADNTICNRLVDECHGEARRLVREHRSQLDAIVERLLDRETLDEAEVYAAAGIEPPPARRGRAGAPEGPRVA